MKADPASLVNLKDIAVPPPVSWWPLAPGWWMLFAVLLVTIIVFAFRFWITWRANAYRRAALRELGAATTAVEIAELLKRTALAAYPRHNVASLSGQAWCRWLEETGGQQASSEVEWILNEGVFGETTSTHLNPLREFISGWIRKHKTPSKNRFQTEERKGSEEAVDVTG